MNKGTKMTIFRELINHNQDHYLPSRSRVPFNEIHRDIHPNLCRDGPDVGRDASGNKRNTMVVWS